MQKTPRPATVHCGAPDGSQRARAPTSVVYGEDRSRPGQHDRHTSAGWAVPVQTMSVAPWAVPTGHVSERPEDAWVIYAEDTCAPEVAASLPLLMSTNCSRDSA
jgi:hypothetical protein